MKTIVVSGVNLRQGGTLAILRDCLQFLSSEYVQNGWRVVAIVHNKRLCDFGGIEYIEIPDTIKSWARRLWCEYVTMNKISKQLSPVSLWLSLHDTSPRVKAEKQAVYCQTSFPFYKSSIRDLFFNYKIVLFSHFTRFAYRINVHSNDYLIVQQSWLKEGLSALLGVEKNKFIVAPPQPSKIHVNPEKVECQGYTFIYPAAPDCHKNFQVLCEAASRLESEIGVDKFSVLITVSGGENRYTGWLKKQWGDVSSLHFVGFLSREQLYGYYQEADCLVFPSKIETWGLPISEFKSFGRPILASKLPYAYGTASGAAKVAFFNPDDPEELKEMMRLLVNGDDTFLNSMNKEIVQEPVAHNWEELFDYLLA